MDETTLQEIAALSQVLIDLAAEGNAQAEVLLRLMRDRVATEVAIDDGLEE